MVILCISFVVSFYNDEVPITKEEVKNNRGIGKSSN